MFFVLSLCVWNSVYLFQICHLRTTSLIVTHFLWMQKRFVCVYVPFFLFLKQNRGHVSYFTFPKYAFKFKIRRFSKWMRKWMPSMKCCCTPSTAKVICYRLKSKICSALVLHLMFAFLLFISNINWIVCFPFPFLLFQIRMPRWWWWYQLPPLQSTLVQNQQHPMFVVISCGCCFLQSCIAFGVLLPILYSRKCSVTFLKMQFCTATSTAMAIFTLGFLKFLPQVSKPSQYSFYFLFAIGFFSEWNILQLVLEFIQANQ